MASEKLGEVKRYLSPPARLYSHTCTSTVAASEQDRKSAGQSRAENLPAARVTLISAKVSINDFRLTQISTPLGHARNSRVNGRLFFMRRNNFNDTSKEIYSLGLPHHCTRSVSSGKDASLSSGSPPSCAYVREKEREREREREREGEGERKRERERARVKEIGNWAGGVLTPDRQPPQSSCFSFSSFRSLFPSPAPSLARSLSLCAPPPLCTPLSRALSHRSGGLASCSDSARVSSLGAFGV